MDLRPFARIRAHQRRVPKLTQQQPTAALPSVIAVAAGALCNVRGEVLLARRSATAHQGGLWEFPGGKLRPGEGAEQALRREIREELGVEVERARRLLRVRHRYDDLDVLLDVWRVERWRGVPRGCEGQPLRWVSLGELATVEMPAADRPVVSALRLPAFCLVTPEPGPDTGAFLARLECAVAGGLRLVQLRAKAMPASSYLRLLEQAGQVCVAHGASLIANPPMEVDADRVITAGADGFHLDSRRLEACRVRPVSPCKWLSAACHDGAQLAMAARAGCDFALLSPVCASGTHPDSHPMGWIRFRELAATCNLPIYALGGMQRSDLRTAWSNGAHGVAAIGGLW